VWTLGASVRGGVCGALRFVVVMVVVSAGVAVPLSPAASAAVPHGVGPPFLVVPSPNAPGALSSVSCTSTTNCFAVGSVVERWNGANWTIVPSPKDVGLSSVSCTSTTNCFAVGISGGAPAVERWNGASWTIVPSPNPNPPGWGYSDLYSVSCTSVTNCLAVGSTGHAPGPFNTFVERWNGTSWAIVPSPNPPSPNPYDDAYWIFVLYGVSCTSTTNCFAVGTAYNMFEDHPPLGFVEHWNGTSWAVVPSPNPPDATYGSELYGVSCTSATNCFAVGHTDQNPSYTLVERWNGAGWEIVPSPSAKRPGARFVNSDLHSVSCTSTTNCFAVGAVAIYDYKDLAAIDTLVERWNGTSWAIVPSANPNGAPYNDLYGVSCTSTTNCFAVGYSASDTDSVTLIERRK
jgi:hypothetical protein